MRSSVKSPPAEYAQQMLYQKAVSITPFCTLCRLLVSGKVNICGQVYSQADKQKDRPKTIYLRTFNHGT